METIVVKIKGLRSAACVSSIEYKLQQLEYVEAVHVDFVTSEALIRSFRKLDIDQIQKVVEENGYSLEISEKASNFRRERPKKDNTLLFSGAVFVNFETTATEKNVLVRATFCVASIKSKIMLHRTGALT